MVAEIRPDAVTASIFESEHVQHNGRWILFGTLH